MAETSVASLKKSTLLSKKTGVSDSESIEDKYQEQIRENLRARRELRRKEWELESLEEKCKSLETTLNKERKRFEAERKEWALFKEDLLLVVRAADDYKTEAMLKVDRYKAEVSQLQEQVQGLEEKLKNALIIS